MSSTYPNIRGSSRWRRYAALALALLWAGWWSFFGLGSGIEEGLDVTGILLHTAIPGLVFLASCAVAWRWQTIGGVVLLLEGLAVAIGYPVIFGRLPLTTILFVLATMALPPVVAGILLLSSRR